MFDYAATVDTAYIEHREKYAYLKYSLRINRRNAILAAIPTLWMISRSGDSEYVGETYDRVYVERFGEMKATRVLERTTFPRHGTAMPTLLQYVTPRIYSEQLIDKRILSPIFRRNKRFYRYRVSDFSASEVKVRFIPRINNTQLVTGWARVERHSGRVTEAAFDGEFDMVRFHLAVTMGRSGVESLLPRRCDLNARFLFMGNDLNAEYTSMYGLPAHLLDSIGSPQDSALFARVRPLPLSPHEERLFVRRQAVTDSLLTDSAYLARRNHKSFASRMWRSVGRNLLDRVKGNFGSRGQGEYRIRPLLNPLFFSYSKRRGFTYKFDVRGSYYFNDHQMLHMRFKSGYSFKQRQFYFNLPVTFLFDTRHGGYIESEWTSGSHISTSGIIEELKAERGDAMDWDNMHLDAFRNHGLYLKAAYNVLPKLSLQAGMRTYRRTAIDRTGFEIVGKPSSYILAAPIVGLEYRPLGTSGPVFTADYERSIKGFMGANMAYERCELDAQYTHWLTALSALQMRLGSGFYTHKGKGWLFLDYTNFRDRNIPGGWNDEWACEFELLNAAYYNSSEYYVRANVTYESPLLMLSWLPKVGRYIEKERIYVNALAVHELHPYIEYGYGFKTRLFSLAAFLSQSNARFEGFSVRMGFELFRSW